MKPASFLPHIFGVLCLGGAGYWLWLGLQPLLERPLPSPFFCGILFFIVVVPAILVGRLGVFLLRKNWRGFLIGLSDIAAVLLMFGLFSLWGYGRPDFPDSNKSLWMGLLYGILGIFFTGACLALPFALSRFLREKIARRFPSATKPGS